jgi:coenzyme F420-reducing hydrogenase alpha subunit
MTANQTTIASAAIHALTFDQRNSAYEQGGRYSHTSAALDEIITSAAKTIGEKPTFEQWTEYADEWKAGYINDNADNTANAADQAWGRFAKRLDERFGLTKPKSTSASAEKKAAEREAKAEKLAAKYADHSTEQLTDNLRKAYELQAKNPTKKLATLKELEQVVKARTREEDTEKREALKTARARLADLAKACDDLDLLETASDILDTASFDVTIE